MHKHHIDLPDNLLCLYYRDTKYQAVYIVRPKSYKDLLTEAVSLFHLEYLAENQEEVFFEIYDDNLGEAGGTVELLPRVWEASGGLTFVKYIGINMRDKADGEQIPSALTTGRKTHHSVASAKKSPTSPPTVKNRVQPRASTSTRVPSQRKSEPEPQVSVGYRGHNESEPEQTTEENSMEQESEEEEELPEEDEQAIKIADTKPRRSLQSNATSIGRPIRIKRDSVRDPGQAQIQESQPLMTQDDQQETAEIPETILITIQYGDQEGTFKAKYAHPVYKVLTRACKHFGIDPYHTKLLHIVAQDGDTSLEPFTCSRDDTLRQLGAQSGDAFLLQVSENSEEEE